MPFVESLALYGVWCFVCRVLWVLWMRIVGMLVDFKEEDENRTRTSLFCTHHESGGRKLRHWRRCKRWEMVIQDMTERRREGLSLRIREYLSLKPMLQVTDFQLHT